MTEPLEPTTPPGEHPEAAPTEGAAAAAESVAYEALQRELERGLAEALGGFRVLDRDLAFDGAEAADLVGLDGTGRLALVILLDPGEAEAALGRALDLLALARTRRTLLERHLGRSISANPGPLAVLVGEEFPEVLARRAAVLGESHVRLLQVRELRSARGTTTWFSPVPQDGDAGGDADVAAYVAGLEASLARRIEELDRRLARLDRDLAAARTPEGVEWRWRGRTVCSVSPWEGRLAGRVEGAEGAEDGPSRELSDPREAEAFLDAALARFLDLSAEGAETPAVPNPLADVELRPAGRAPRAEAPEEPLLSQEELDAFYDQ